MKLCSFNVWSDAAWFSRWAVRRDAVGRVIARCAPDVAGLQEASLPMIRDLVERLPDYRWVGVGREDGKEAGEFTPIFYHAERVELVEHSSFWLAADCARPGRGWDAACCRVATWARFLHRESGRRFVHLNTHLDHMGREARVQSARLLLQKSAEIAKGEPVALSGDFNSRETSAPYRILTGMLPFTDGETGLRDSRAVCESAPEGPRRTFRGFLGQLGFGRIDYVFVNEGFCVRRYAVIDDVPAASDHRAVVVDLAFAGMLGG